MTNAPRSGGVTVIGCVQADVIVAPVTDLPAPGATLLADQMSVRIGGAGANAALAFAETPMPVRLMGCVGDDQIGDWMRRELVGAGLADELSVLDGRPTGLTVALESEQRDRTFITYLGVNSDWRPEMLPADALDCAAVLLCDYFVAPGFQGEAARTLLEQARARGARTYFDTAWDPAGFGEAARREVRGLLGAVDVFLPNEAEACAIANTAPGETERAARILQADSGGWIVVKLGARGCLAIGPDGERHAVPAPSVVVHDTTGAGDAFNAGLVAALDGGEDWPDALAAATRLASSIVARPSHERGARPAGDPDL